MTIQIPNRLQDIDFRILLEKRLQRECPAHILMHFIYPDVPQFSAFQVLYKRWHLWKRMYGTPLVELETVQNEIVLWLNNSSPTIPASIN